MKLSRKEIVEELARQGYFPGKWGFRAVIDMVREFERRQAKRCAA